MLWSVTRRYLPAIAYTEYIDKIKPKINNSVESKWKRFIVSSYFSRNTKQGVVTIESFFSIFFFFIACFFFLIIYCLVSEKPPPNISTGLQMYMGESSSNILRTNGDQFEKSVHHVGSGVFFYKVTFFSFFIHAVVFRKNTNHNHSSKNKKLKKTNTMFFKYVFRLNLTN